MGFSSVIAQTIMFIAVMGVATGLVAVFNNYMDENTGAMNAQWQVMSSNMKTDVTITNVAWDGGATTTTIYALNTGKTTLDPTSTDVYIDGMFIPRSEDNRTINVSASTDLRNPDLWDPGEVLEIVVDMGLDAGTHYVDVGTQYGVKDSETFTV